MGQSNKIAVPETVAGIQVNFCKTLGCPNFGEPIQIIKRPRGRPTKSSELQNQRYIPIGDSYLKCKYCKISFPLKSNQGIHEELTRLNSYRPILPETGICPNPECSNHREKIHVKAGVDYYTSHGPLSNGRSQKRRLS